MKDNTIEYLLKNPDKTFKLSELEWGELDEMVSLPSPTSADCTNGVWQNRFPEYKAEFIRLYPNIKLTCVANNYGGCILHSIEVMPNTCEKYDKWKSWYFNDKSNFLKGCKYTD